MPKGGCRWSALPGPMQKVFSYINSNRTKFVYKLSEAIAIRSVSADPTLRDEVIKMVHWVDGKLRDLGCTTTLHGVGEQIIESESFPLPPIIFATYGNDPKKKTVLIYGHVDVQPAKMVSCVTGDGDNGWDTDPFVLTPKDCKLYGRGTTDDKGPVIGWLNVLEAYQRTAVEVPVNIKFLFEAMEESGSEGLEELLAKETGFLQDTDAVCISDNYWLGTKKPCLTYGLRGLCAFSLTVDGGTKDLHSGIFGGAVIEPLNDLVWMLSQLADREGKILIPGVLDNVAPVTPEEEARYKNIDFSVDDFKSEAGVHSPRFDEKTDTLMHRWRLPSLSLHGIEGAFCETGHKTVIPRRVTGKFTIRIVPNMDPDRVNAKVTEYINQLWAKRKSPNLMTISIVSKSKPWLTDPEHPNFLAAKQASKMVYGMDPDLTREGGSIPIALTLQEATGKNVLLLPMGASDDGAHSQNEKIDIRNYVEGMKVFAAYLYELGKISNRL